MTDKARAMDDAAGWRRRLAGLRLGDIIHASEPNDASLVCIIEALTDQTIATRTATHQIELVFDRDTGVARWDDTPCTIDSIAPLPPPIDAAIRGLDRRYRQMVDLDEAMLSRSEIDALSFIGSFYAEHPV